MYQIALFCLFFFPLSAYQYSCLFEGDQVVHIVQLDEEEELGLIKADSREYVSLLAQDRGARCAINGGFFLENGQPAGALKIEERWVASARHPRGCVGWNHNEAHIAPFLSKEQWQDYPNVVQGVPILVRDGHAVWDYTEEQIGIPTFITERHARSAIGITTEGKLLLVVVEGASSGGMTLAELTHLMLSLGCIEALNLDGGGSSTMVIEGVVVYGLSSEERKVSDAILVLEKKDAKL